MAIKIINPIINHVEGGGASFNIHYGLNPPEDTSMLWVETEREPTSVLVENDDPLQYRLSHSADDIANSPEQRRNGAIAQVGDNVYIFGGYNNNNIKTDTIWKYDRANNTFAVLSQTTPAIRTYGACGAFGDKIYLLGGIEDSSAVATIYVFDTTTEQLAVLEGVVLPEPLSSIGNAVIGTKMYLFGGGTNKILVFDSEKNSVTEATAVLPKNMSNICAVANGRKVYLFGGKVSSTEQKTIYIYDTESDVISTSQATLLKGDSDMCGGTIEEKIYVLGYANNTSQIYSYDIPSDTIVTLSVEPYRYNETGQMAAIYGKDMLIFGGNRSYRDELSNQVFSVSSRIAEGSAYIKPTLDKNVFALLSGDNTVNIGASGVYIGTEDYAQKVNAYLYNETSQAWELI